MATVVGARVGLGDCANVSRSRALMQIIVADFAHLGEFDRLFLTDFLLLPPPQKN